MRPWLPRLLPALATAWALYLVVAVHAAGESLLAVLLLSLAVMLLWVYTSARTLALRYLFPGVATALIFVVFPMVYTVSTGFTNYSSAHLVDEGRARAVLLDEWVERPGDALAFTLHRQDTGWVLALDGGRWVSP